MTNILKDVTLKPDEEGDTTLVQIDNLVRGISVDDRGLGKGNSDSQTDSIDMESNIIVEPINTISPFKTLVEMNQTVDSLEIPNSSGKVQREEEIQQIEDDAGSKSQEPTTSISLLFENEHYIMEECEQTTSEKEKKRLERDYANKITGKIIKTRSLKIQANSMKDVVLKRYTPERLSDPLVHVIRNVERNSRLNKDKIFSNIFINLLFMNFSGNT